MKPTKEKGTGVMNFTHTQDGECTEKYHYTECGLDNIYLTNGFIKRQTKYGEAVAVMHADELLLVIAEALATCKRDLNGAEIKFLRHRLDVTQGELGRLIGMDQQTIGRWERDESINPAGVNIIRKLFLDQFHPADEQATTLRDLLDDLAQFDDDAGASFCMSYSENESWDSYKLLQAA